MPGVVEPFVRQSGSQRAVADDRGDLEIFAFHVAAHGHPERGRNGRRRVSGAERVVLALAALEKPRDAVFLAQRLHSSVSAGQQLVRIALVADVPHDLIAGRVERVVERDGQLDDSEPGADVASGARADVDQPRANVVGQVAKLVAAHPADVRGRRDAVEDAHG